MGSDYLIQILLTITAVFSNFLSAFSGGGAGLIQLPTLLFLGLSFPQALSTHKLASVALGLGASLRHLRENTLNLRLSIIIASFGIPGVVLGAKTILLIPSKYSTLLLGIITLFLATYSFSINTLEASSQDKNQSKIKFAIGCIVLFLLGFLNGSLASGSGLFMTLWLVKWFNFSYKKAIAHTLVLVGLAWNSTGAIILSFTSEVKWEWLTALISGSLIGGYLGAHFAILKGEKSIKFSFEFIATIMGISLLAKSFN